MKIKVETYAEYKYDEIEREYGYVLHKYGLIKSDDGSAYINVNTVEDLIKIDKDMRCFCDERDEWSVYFGVMVTTHFDGEPLIEIKDNYD